MKENLMNLLRFYVTIFASLASTLGSAEDMRTPDDMLWSTAQCEAVKVDLVVNHRTVAQPTLYIKNADELKEMVFEVGSCYSELKCVEHEGRNGVHFVESACGNAYEIYWVVDLQSYEKYDLDYATAKKLGFVDY